MLRSASLWLALLAAPACAHATRPGPPGWHYTVSVAPDLGRLDVEVCFRRPQPTRLVADDDTAADYLVAPRDAANGRVLPVEDGRVIVGAAGPCITYGVDIARMIEEVDRDAMARTGDAIAGSPHLWLWRPEVLPDSAEITLSFELPAGVAASVPWPQSADGTYALSSTAFSWATQVVLGEFTADRFAAAGTDFKVAILDRPRAITEAGVRRWLTTAAETVALLYGGFPTPTMQVVVVPFPGGGDPVYFGMALRGGGPAVMLLISDTAEDAAFPGEWVAIHELLHHGMPFVQHDDAWMSEGFVTYYTEVLRVRAGLRTQLASWRALLAGFARGARSGSGVPLADESVRMHESHAYQRVYWGGAAIALLLDVALREAGSSLDAAMRHLDACCGDTRKIWRADAILAEWERWRGGRSPSLRDIVTPVLQRAGGPWRADGTLPELSAVYRKLGVNMVSEEPTLDESASIAHVRRAIFTAP